MEAIDSSQLHSSELFAIIVAELRESYGIKYRKEKKTKATQEKANSRRIFNVALEKLQMTDVLLASGATTRVPQFVADACQRILEQVGTEGLFRKAGSAARQREIRAHLEAGIPLGTAHHVIDVANVLKLFLRELPEPLLAPGAIQDALLRCLLCGDRRSHALLLACLLLPALALNTLRFLMQFLHTVSQHAASNRMTAENLAIIFAPGLMPLPEIVPQRLDSHCRVIRALIELAPELGAVPRYIRERLQQRVSGLQQQQQQLVVAELQLQVQQPQIGRGRSKSMAAQHQQQLSPIAAGLEADEPATAKKKKKRRSGMLNGLRKIVGNAISGSTDELDTTPEPSGGGGSGGFNPVTPLVMTKTAKKRKQQEAGAASGLAGVGIGFSAKKKKDVLALLPENDGDGGGQLLLPSTPMCVKNPKKSRLSLGGNKHKKTATATTSSSSSTTTSSAFPTTPGSQFFSDNPSAAAAAPPMERRWSVVGAPWSRKKATASSSRLSRLDDLFGSRKSVATAAQNAAERAVANNAAASPMRRLRADSLDNSATPTQSRATSEAASAASAFAAADYLDNLRINDDQTGDDFMRISKSEYEAIKERVSAIETRISQEFGAVVRANMSVDSIDGVDSVLHKYERTLEKTEPGSSSAGNQMGSGGGSSSASSPSTEALAKRLSRELKIRRSAEHSSAAVIRSPSARKIGTLRRRSRESAVRLSRNFSWHVGTGQQRQPTQTQQQQPQQPTTAQLPQHRPVATTMPQSADECDLAAAAVAAATAAAATTHAQLQGRANLKRGRPNTVQTGLRHPSPTKKVATGIIGPASSLAAVAAAAGMAAVDAVGDGMDGEVWTSGEQFFADPGTPGVKKGAQQQQQQQMLQPQTPQQVQPTASNQENEPRTPHFISTAALNEIKTPMLPPRRPLTHHHRTPLTLHNSGTPLAPPKTPMLPPRSTTKLLASAQQLPSKAPTPHSSTSAIINKALATPMSADNATGRASIARLRSQNAGQVAAKARLFQAFVTAETVEPTSSTAAAQSQPPAPALLPILQHHQHQRRQSAAFQLLPARGGRPTQVGGRPSLLPSNLAAIKFAADAAGNKPIPNSPRRPQTPSSAAKRRASSAAKNHLNGVHRRQKLRLAKTPIQRGSPQRLRHLLVDDAADRPSPSGGRNQQRKQKAQFRAAMESIVADGGGGGSGSPAASGTPRRGNGRRSQGGGNHTPQRVSRNSPRLQTRGEATLY